MPIFFSFSVYTFTGLLARNREIAACAEGSPSIGYGAPTMDAFAPMQTLLQTVDENRTGGSTTNFGHYANRQLDALLDKTKREPDMKARDTLIRDALMIARDDLALIPLIQTVQAWAMRSNLDAPYVPNSLPYFYRFGMK